MLDDQSGIVTRARFAAAGVSPEEDEIRDFAASIPWLQSLVERYRPLAEDEPERPSGPSNPRPSA